MGVFYVLYLNDSIVSPCLELIHKISEPKSTSKPHVTVRGPVRRTIQKGSAWQNIRISSVDLIEPGTFFLNAKDARKQNTVYIRCSFMEVSQAWYKPDYPISIPHLTIYDGPSRELAENIFELLRRYFFWRFRVSRRFYYSND